jgi:hypothetical protein
MSAERFHRCTGRAVTDVTTSGRVEVAGEEHDAFAAGAPIAAGQPVVVEGWRAAGASGYMLSFGRGPRASRTCDPGRSRPS